VRGWKPPSTAGRHRPRVSGATTLGSCAPSLTGFHPSPKSIAGRWTSNAKARPPETDARAAPGGAAAAQAALRAETALTRRAWWRGCGTGGAARGNRLTRRAWRRGCGTGATRVPRASRLGPGNLTPHGGSCGPRRLAGSTAAATPPLPIESIDGPCARAGNEKGPRAVRGTPWILPRPVARAGLSPPPVAAARAAGGRARGASRRRPRGPGRSRRSRPRRCRCPWSRS
jgi:hypothetical protein